MLRKYLKLVVVYLKIVMPRNVLFMFLRELMMIIGSLTLVTSLRIL